MKRTNLITLLLVVLCLALLPAGFAAADEAEHEPVTLMDAQRDYRELLKILDEQYPEVNIEILPYRGGNMSAFCKQQAETGIMPDIYSTTQAWDSALLKADLVDLSQFPVTELYNAARLQEYSIDGGIYLLPFDFSITGILCNKSLLDRSGIEIPTSFAQLRDETIPALKEKGIKISNVLLDLPGSAFQYFFNVGSTVFMNNVKGRAWRNAFTDLSSDTYASDNEDIKAVEAYFQEWIDCGMLNYDPEVSYDHTTVLTDFQEGNTAFLIGTVKQFSQNEDGTGDQYVLIPWLSEDGENNTYITSPTRFYGLNKSLLEPGNEQKLEDALHFLEVLSTNEGYIAMNGEQSTNMCSIKDFKLSEDSPYFEAMKAVGKGFSMNLIYTGWDSYLVPFGEAARSWIKGEITGDEAIAVLDETKKATAAQGGQKVYATATERLDTVQAAQLCGQMFMEATGADAALISYNVYYPEVHALWENSRGANGAVLPGGMTEEYITVFLPTGWYGTLTTMEITGKQAAELAAAGCDTRDTGVKYPYVYMTADGQPLAEDETYTVVICGYDKGAEEIYSMTDTGIVGLDAAKAYLEKVGEVSSATLDESLVLSKGFSED